MHDNGPAVEDDEDDDVAALAPQMSSLFVRGSSEALMDAAGASGLGGALNGAHDVADINDPEPDYGDSDAEDEAVLSPREDEPDYSDSDEHEEDEEDEEDFVPTAAELQEGLEGQLDFAAFECTASFFQGSLDARCKEMYGEKIPGYCVPLVLKWLMYRGDGLTPDFFTAMEEPGARDEIIRLGKEKISHPSVLANYHQRLKYDVESADDFSEPGLYQLSCTPEDGLGHLMGLHVESAGSLILFDPNYGEFSFKSEVDLRTFLERYMEKTYAEDRYVVDDTYVRMIKMSSP